MTVKILCLISIAVLFSILSPGHLKASTLEDPTTNILCNEGYGGDKPEAGATQDAAVPNCKCMPAAVAGACGCSGSTGTPVNLGREFCQQTIKQYGLYLQGCTP